MATRVVLSASTNGRPILVAATTSPGTLIHTAGSSVEAVTLWAKNSGASDVVLKVEWGETAGTATQIPTTIEPDETLLIVDRLRLGATKTINAFEAGGTDVHIIGHADQLS